MLRGEKSRLVLLDLRIWSVIKKNRFSMVKYCIQTNCPNQFLPLDGERMHTKCGVCRTKLVDTVTKENFHKLRATSPKLISDSYYSYAIVPDENRKESVWRGIQLIQTTARFIGLYFVHEHMRLGLRNDKANELIQCLYTSNSVRSWCDWLEYVSDNSSQMEAFDQGSFLENCTNHHKKTYLWHSDAMESMVKIPCSLLEMVSLFDLHMKQQCEVTNAHRWMMRRVVRDFIRAVDQFLSNRFVEFSIKDKNLKIDLLLGDQAWSNDLLNFTNHRIFLARDDSGYKLLNPFFTDEFAQSFSETSVELARQKKPWKSIEKPPLFDVDEIRPEVKKTMTRISEEEFEKLKKASQVKQPKQRDELFSELNRDIHIDNRDYERLNFLKHFNEKIGNQNFRAIELNELTTYFNQIYLEGNWRQGLYNALLAGNVFWYLNESKVIVEMNPFNQLK
jgi:hypothetical protein